MKTVVRLVTESPSVKDSKGNPKWIYNDYLSTTFVRVNESLLSFNAENKQSGGVKVGDSIHSGEVVKIVKFEYEDYENPSVIA